MHQLLDKKAKAPILGAKVQVNLESCSFWRVFLYC